jgi:hypothetical protein
LETGLWATGGSRVHQDLDVLARRRDGVRDQGRYLEQAQARHVGDRRAAVAGDALAHLRVGLREVDLHADTGGGGTPGDLAQQLRRARVRRVGPEGDAHLPVPGEVPGELLRQVHRGPAVLRARRGEPHRLLGEHRGRGQHPHPGRHHVTEQGGVPAEHVRERRRARAQHLDHGQAQAPGEVLCGEPDLEPAHVAQPLRQVLVVGEAAQRGHRGVGVRVHQARHDDVAGHVQVAGTGRPAAGPTYVIEPEPS